MTNVTLNGYTFKVRMANLADDIDQDQTVKNITKWAEAMLQILPPTPRELFNGDGPDLDSWRPGQREIAAFAMGSTKMGLFDSVYIDAPTGSGKSIIAQALADLIKSTVGDRPIVATLDHSLQEQYAETKAVGSLTGRSNWPCLVDPTRTAANAICTTRIKPSSCEFYAQCPYFMQKKQALKKPVTVTNYAWLEQGGGNALMGYPLIGDEAHMVEQITREAAAVSIPVETIFPKKDRINLVARGRGPFPALRDPAWRKAAQDRQRELTEKILQNRNQWGFQETEENPILDVAYKHLLHQNRLLLKAIPSLRPEDKGIYWAMDGQDLRLEPLIATPYILGSGMGFYLSATIIDPAGADTCPLIFIEMPSSFPKERRPVKVQRVAKMGAKATELDLQAMASFIDNTLIKHNNEKGVIHCVSYSLAEELKARSKYPQMLISHKPGERDRAIAEFKAAPMGRALLSPSVSTGLDLPDDLCRFQVIAKMPFLNMGDPILKARMENFPDAANLDVARTIVQAAGRGMRSETDHCVTYIADANFGWFYKQNQKFFPDWFREAVI
jgi:ATP-dependent DNA helicase DinG